MFEIEYVENGSGNVIRTRAKSQKQKRSILKAIDRLKGHTVVVREKTYEDTFNVWLYVPEKEKFIQVSGPSVNRSVSLKIFADWDHRAKNAIPVLWPTDQPVPKSFSS